MIGQKSSATSVIHQLRSAGLITNIMGTIPDDGIRPALVVWARKDPKSVFRFLTTLSKVISRTRLTVFVDDLCARVLLHRSSQEQQELNAHYVDFFSKEECDVKLSSDLYRDERGSEAIFPLLLTIAQRVSVAEFVRCLPEEKRERLGSMNLSEIMHALFELTLFEQAQKTCNTVLIGSFSQAIVACHRNISNDPMTALIVPTVQNLDDIDQYIKSLLLLRGDLSVASF